MAVVKKNVTLKMVAERVGCSIAVVSTVLNSAKGRTKVCDKTRQRVLEIAREMDYTPNYASQSLKANSSRTWESMFSRSRGVDWRINMK